MARSPIRPPSIDPKTGRPAARINPGTVTGFSSSFGFGIHKTGAIRVRGIERAKRTIEKLRKENPNKLARGLHNAGRFLKQESKKLVPVDTGYLKSTAYFRVIKRVKSVNLDVGYTAPYAVYVHEILTNFHPIGQAKYLEEPARQYREHMKYLVLKEYE